MAKSAGDQIDYERLVDYHRDMRRGLERRKDKLTELKRALTALGHSTNYEGATADAIRNYVDEVHVDGIISELVTLIERFETILDGYVAGYTSVDGDTVFRLVDQDYEALQKNIKAQKPKINPIRRNVVNALDAVDDIVSTSGRKRVNTNGASLEDRFDNMNRIIEDQQEKWGMYEVDHARDTDDLQTAIAKIRSMVNQYTNGKQPSFDQYQAGGFDFLAGQAFLGAMAGMAAQNRQYANLDRQMLRMIQDYHQDQDDFNKKIAEQRANEQKDRWAKVWVNGLFLIAGVGLTILTAGAATPLVTAMFVANTVFSLSDLAGNIQSASLNEDHVGLFEELFQSGFGKQNGSIAYSSLELATSVFGSGKAVTELTDAQYFVHGASKLSVLSTYKEWNAVGKNVGESGLGAHMAWGALKSNARVLKQSLISAGNGEVLPKLTLDARQNALGTFGAAAKVYGKEAGKEFGKDYVNDKIDQSFTEPTVKEIPTLGGKVIFRSGVKAFTKNEDKIWSKIILEGD